MDKDECVVVSNENNDTNDNLSRNKGSRPIRTTTVCKHKNELRRIKVHNNIIMKYVVQKISLPYGKRLRRGRLNEIIEEFASKYGLDTSDVCSTTIRKSKNSV